MSKVLILVDNIGPKKELFRKLIAERLGSNIEVVLEKFSDTSIEIDGNEIPAKVGQSELKDFDLVYFRRIDHSIFPLSHTLALILDKYGVKYFDTTFREVGAGGDKVTSIVRLALSGVPVPKTIFITRDNILGSKDKIVSDLGLPFIAKDTKAQRNTGVFVVKNGADFEKLLDSKNVRPNGYPAQLLLQKFVDIEAEYRLLVLKDEVAVVHTKIKRKYEDMVVGYEKPEEEPEFLDPEAVPTILKDAAIKSAKVLGIEIAGVDGCVEKGTGKPIIFEVNRGPGLEYDTKKSPEISKIADFFKKELSNNG